MSDNAPSPQTPANPGIPPVPPLPPHGAAPAYAPPHGYGAPPAPGVPPAYAYALPTAPFAPAARPASAALGVVALVIALVGVIVSTIVGIAAGINAGPAFIRALEYTNPDGSIDLTLLSPARAWVLTGEISFWCGTALGIWAIVQGIVAMASRRGFGAGLAAAIIAGVGPIVFFGALTLAMGVGMGLAGAV